EAQSGQTWFALARDGDGYALHATTISVATVNDPIVDAEDEATGKEVAVDVSGDVIALFPQMDELSPELVATADQHGAFGAFLYPGQSVYLEARALDRPLTLFAYGRVEPYVQEGWHTLRIREYTVAVKYVDNETLAICELATADELTEDGGPRLLFAGDMNRDGHLDL